MKTTGRIKSFLAVFLAVTLIVTIDILFEVNVPKTVAVNIESPKISVDAPIRVAQISDTHGYLVSPHRLLMRNISEFNPQAIFFTGDIIDKSTADFSFIYEDIGNLLKIAPVIFVTGNHEFANPEGEEFVSKIREIGVTVLRSQSVEINESLSVSGIDDVHFKSNDMIRAAENINSERFNILLSHTPSVALDLKKEDMIDLVLSGHTHGGQIRIPLLGAVFLPEGTDRRLIKGLTVLENGITVYVDSGFGTSALPVRFMNQSQISLITIY